MLLGIDFGTTRTVVATVDRGNYPVASFQLANGDSQDWYPYVIAARGSEFQFGFDAAARQAEIAAGEATGWKIRRGFKRKLAQYGPDTPITINEQPISALDLLTAFLAQLRSDLIERSNLRLPRRYQFETMISVPANANSNQRFITLEAFRRAGFEVRGMINEPSAAGIEYAHQVLSSDSTPRREHLVVYDLGGGTFDAAVISIAHRMHDVLSSDGIARLGGEDFDQILLDLALEQAGITEITRSARQKLLEECREKKEGLHPNTRKLAIDLERGGSGTSGAGEVIVTTADYYERCRPLVERTIEATERAIHKALGAADTGSLSAVYLVGGSSDLPVVARTLRERYGRLVRRSPYPHAATAIGLAIAADAGAGYRLRESFTRYFGVWRESDNGKALTFDVIFDKDTRLPEKNGVPLMSQRRYHSAHNLGHYRYLECSNISRDNGLCHPRGDITPWDEVRFPFALELREDKNLEERQVRRLPGDGNLIEETYTCNQHGIIEVQITDLTDFYQQSFRLRGKKS